MTLSWLPKETTKHQDHVIAHVLGAAVPGYFVFEETVYLLLNIGFIWNIFLDGEMGLLPHAVAIAELEGDDRAKAELKTDVDILLGDGLESQLLRFRRLPIAEGKSSEIVAANFFEDGDRRLLRLTFDETDLAIETSLETAEIKLYELESTRQ